MHYIYYIPERIRFLLVTVILTVAYKFGINHVLTGYDTEDPLFWFFALVLALLTQITWRGALRLIPKQKKT